MEDVEKKKKSTKRPKDEVVVEKKRPTKKAKRPPQQQQEEGLLSRHELAKAVNLSVHMLNVAMDMLDKSSAPLVLVDIVCVSKDIVPLDKETVESYRHECEQHQLKKQKKRATATSTTNVKTEDEEEKKKKVFTDDDVRKFIVERREKELIAGGVRLAGSEQTEKMDNGDKDRTLVSEFIGSVTTSKGYSIYAYYVGPHGVTDKNNPRYWLPVNKTHLPHFHRRLQRSSLKTYFTHTKFDATTFKVEGSLNAMPAYDPRFIMMTWLAKEGSVHKALLQKHCAFFREEKDFLVKHYEEKEQGNALHYYDATKPDTLVIDLQEDMDVEQNGGIFNAEADHLRQQMNGYRYDDKELCHVSIEEFPPLSRIPLPKEVDLTFEEFLKIARHVYVNEQNPRPPENYITDPFLMVKPAIMALNMEMLARRVLPIVGDENLQILEADNTRPILDYFGDHKSCTDEIKEATKRYLLSLFATEVMCREVPPEIQKILDQSPELILLDS